MMWTQSECKQICYHMYTCGKYCYYYTNGNLCEHIHRSHSMWMKLREPKNYCHFELSCLNGSGAECNSDIDDTLEFAKSVRNPSKGMLNYDYMQVHYNFDYCRPDISTNYFLVIYERIGKGSYSGEHLSLFFSLTHINSLLNGLC